jgi:hypothetical protein
MTIINKKINRPVMPLFCLAIFGLAMSACDLVDPTSVRNPQATEESLREGGTGATRPFLNGVVFRFSDAVEDVAYYTDVVSDNYDNISTFISPQRHSIAAWRICSRRKISSPFPSSRMARPFQEISWCSSRSLTLKPLSPSASMRISQREFT